MFPPATTLQVLRLSWYSGTLLPRWPEFSSIQGLLKPKKGYKSKYHRDMGYGVKMRIYVFLEQCMHFCIFPGFQLSHLWRFYKSSLFLSCFHPQRHSRSSASPGTVVLSCRDGQSFHQSRGYWGLR